MKFKANIFLCLLSNYCNGRISDSIYFVCILKMIDENIAQNVIYIFVSNLIILCLFVFFIYFRYLTVYISVSQPVRRWRLSSVPRELEIYSKYVHFSRGLNLKINFQILLVCHLPPNQKKVEKH